MMERKSRVVFEIAPQEENLPALITFDDEYTVVNGERILKVRLDKWLWAARFFKTRPLARAAIEQGKILYDGQKSTPGKEIEVGAVVTLNQGRHRKSVAIRGLSTRRRNLDEGHALYEEIESIYTNNIEITVTSDDDFFNRADNGVPVRKAVRYLRRSMSVGDLSSKAADHKD